MKQQKTFFDEDLKRNRLSNLGDPLVKVAELVNFELFRPLLEAVLPKIDRKIGGRPRFDSVMMSKILLLQEYYGLSDHGIEFQITDRLTFMRFLKLNWDSKVPDSNTIWNFRELLTVNNTIDSLFFEFEKFLRDKNLILEKGRVIDATFVSAPVQRNSKEDNKLIKSGELPKDWSKKKVAHKDLDANWTQKNGKNIYGYKNHIKIDLESKLILGYVTSAASVHDSQVLSDLMDEIDTGKHIYADSAYRTPDNFALLETYKCKAKLNYKPYKNRPLTQSEKNKNKTYSQRRCRVEHVFGNVTTTTGGYKTRVIGINRTHSKIGLRNLWYNCQRATVLTK